MAVTILQTHNGLPYPQGIPTKSVRNSPAILDFWLAANFFDPTRPPLLMGYSVAAPGGPFFVMDMESQPGTLATHRTRFESFLMLLYGAGINLGGATVFTLESEMKAAGATVMRDQYRFLDELIPNPASPAEVMPSEYPARALDFMVLTGAKKRYYRQPSGEITDLMSLGATDIRPVIADVEDNDRALMFKVIEQLGIPGVLKYLYAQEGISFVELCENLKTFLPTQAQRFAYLPELTAFLRQRRVPILSPEQINAFLS